MAGSWYEIKNKKIALDKKRGATFTKLAKAITVAVKQGGGDVATNAALDVLIRKAKVANMTNDIIDRAIKKGKGETNGEADLMELLYEGYGPLGIPMLVVALTDNPNRTVAHVRHIFSKYGGKSAESGSVSFQFKKRGIIQAHYALSQEDAELALMDAGVEDYTLLETGVVQAICSPTELAKVLKALPDFQIDDAKIGFVPLSTTTLSDEDMETLATFIGYMEDSDDIQEIYSTISMS